MSTTSRSPKKPRITVWNRPGHNSDVIIPLEIDHRCLFSCGRPDGGTGRAENGALIFDSHCAACHFADKFDRKIGPGLKGILKKEKLPAGGRPANPENNDIMGKRMPLNRTPLKDTDIQAIRNWIISLKAAITIFQGSPVPPEIGQKKC